MAIQSVPMPFFRHPLRNSEALSLHAARALPSAVLTRIEGAGCATYNPAKPAAGTAAVVEGGRPLPLLSDMQR